MELSTHLPAIAIFVTIAVWTNSCVIGVIGTFEEFLMRTHWSGDVDKIGTDFQRKQLYLSLRTDGLILCSLFTLLMVAELYISAIVPAKVLVWQGIKFTLIFLFWHQAFSRFFDRTHGVVERKSIFKRWFKQ